MREIKFRARLDKKAFPRSYNKGWAYGFVSRNDDGWAIDTFGDVGGFVGNGQYLSIDGETVGQYTGLKDKNGTEIYEGDITKGHYWMYGKEYRFIGVVEYIGSGFKARGVKQYKGITAEFNPTFKVIGNRFENPELLEVTE